MTIEIVSIEEELDRYPETLNDFTKFTIFINLHFVIENTV